MQSEYVVGRTTHVTVVSLRPSAGCAFDWEPRFSLNGSLAGALPHPLPNTEPAVLTVVPNDLNVTTADPKVLKGFFLFVNFVTNFTCNAAFVVT